MGLPEQVFQFFQVGQLYPEPRHRLLPNGNGYLNAYRAGTGLRDEEALLQF